MIARLALTLAIPALFAGCDRAGRGGGEIWQDIAAPSLSPLPRPEPGAPQPRGARTAEAFDRTSAADKAAALAAPADGAVLGKVVVSLGNPAEQGFWVRSALVAAPRPGTVRLASGQTAQVGLLPLTGGGPQMSLATFRALGLGLTDLPEVTVLGR